MLKTNSCEPNYAKACEWWTDLPNIWTPIGWRDHMFRFNIFWNGTILAKPNLNRRTEKYAGQGVHVTVMPSYSGAVRGRPSYVVHDDGMVKQGWQDCATPVLWSEWSQDGVLLREHAFAHVPGGREVATGIEPLFAWVRLSVAALCPGLPLEDKHGFVLRLNAPHVGTSMSMRDNVRLIEANSKYPRRLKAESAKYNARRGWRVVEAGGKVRLGIAAGQDCSVVFRTPVKSEKNCDVYIRMEAKEGAHADVLIPMLPTDRKVFDAELAMGYDAALRESHAYWSPVPKTAARFEVPEAGVNGTIRHSLRLAQIIAEKNPETGKYCLINGSLTYAALWATPGAMTMAMLMDLLGHHDAVGKYLEIFREEQGTVVPPGDAYKPHPGYLSTPALYKSIDWLSDNGAILYLLGMHGLLSGDRKYIERFTDTIVKSCDWIRDSRAMRKHSGVKGILPAAVATDKGTRIQAVWNDGWNYKGLATAVKLLKQIGHQRAAEFEAEAKDYKDAFVAEYRRKYRTMPAWKDAKGRAWRLVPTALTGDEKEESRHAFFLDTGALFPVFAGIMDAEDELMEAIRLWFREGPQNAFYRRDANCWQVPVLDREMSSCEPCYSWNVFHSHRLGDRQRFLEGMYSLFAGSVSRQTFISCETRGGITGNIFSAPVPVYMARLAVIDDEIREDELHLLRLMPKAWLEPGAESVFENMPTTYGPVTLKTKVAKDGKTLDVVFDPSFRSRPKAVVLHRPPVDGLAAVRVNGKAVELSGDKAIVGNA